MCPRWGGRRLRGPGTSAGCHTTGCRPSRGLWRSAGNTRPPPPPCTHTSTRGKPEASSPSPPPAQTHREVKYQKEKETNVTVCTVLSVCESHDLATALTAHMLIVATSLIRAMVITWAIHTQPGSELHVDEEILCFGFYLILLTNHFHHTRFRMNVCICTILCTNHATALLAAVQPGCSTWVEFASALVQTLTAGPVVTAGTAEQIFVWVSTVTGPPPAVRLPVLYNISHSGQTDLGHDMCVWLQRNSASKDFDFTSLYILGWAVWGRLTFNSSLKLKAYISLVEEFK